MGQLHQTTDAPDVAELWDLETRDSAIEDLKPSAAGKDAWCRTIHAQVMALVGGGADIYGAPAVRALFSPLKASTMTTVLVEHAYSADAAQVEETLNILLDKVEAASGANLPSMVMLVADQQLYVLLRAILRHPRSLSRPHIARLVVVIPGFIHSLWNGMDIVRTRYWNSLLQPLMRSHKDLHKPGTMMRVKTGKENRLIFRAIMMALNGLLLHLLALMAERYPGPWSPYAEDEYPA